MPHLTSIFFNRSPECPFMGKPLLACADRFVKSGTKTGCGGPGPVRCHPVTRGGSGDVGGLSWRFAAKSSGQFHGFWPYNPNNPICPKNFTVTGPKHRGLKVRGVPSNHPFIDGGVSIKPSILGAPPCMETPLVNPLWSSMGGCSIGSGEGIIRWVPATLRLQPMPFGIPRRPRVNVGLLGVRLPAPSSSLQLWEDSWHLKFSYEPKPEQMVP